ncbi:MAG TPA: tetratricopeptide repeat protein [Azospirillum sp.]|nr:tetratricopeptide repeat protein [Azospirillum sp.]
MLGKHFWLVVPWTTPAVALTALLATTALSSEEHVHQALGKVHFPVTCGVEAQATFDEAMKLQHSFWHEAAITKYQEVLKRDPSCVMAYWGQALALLDNPFSPPPAKNLAEGLSALEAAQKIGPKTQREADYIDAMLAFYRDHDKLDHRTRVLAFEQAMETLAARYPDDPEARIYYALALNMAASPTDKTYAKPLKAADILEAEWQRQPEHPGVAHYLIHTYDFQPLAPKGMKAAELYSEIAPDAPHALHMPSHIFTRVGHWEQSVASNSKSAEIARKDGSVGNELHALDYMVYAHLQLGQVEAARQILKDLDRFANVDLNRVSLSRAAVFAMAAIPARVVMERGAWEEAATLQPRKTVFPVADALTHYTRAVGFARSGKPDQATADIAALKEKVDALRGKDAYWMEQVDIQRQAAEAWEAFAKGNRENALDGMRSAADREGKTEKHVITPGPLAPAREQLGEMLLDMNRPGDALKEFEAVQQTEPNRFRAIYGTARAAEMLGNRETAKQHYGKLIAITAKADAARPEVTMAKAFMAAN